ncbi:MAG TPA: TetR/AcrR family transcriptional regulator [Actinocrinis sp.]|nr:TetR/AcrR family transcriptional regulator [Actinocrinis sp.]
MTPSPASAPADADAADAAGPPEDADTGAPLAHPRASRRRGQSLTRAIYLATLNELAESSMEQLGFDKIAARAGAGKASLYRRWDSPAELLLEALADPDTGFSEPAAPHTGSVESDLAAMLTDFAEALDQPHGRALRPLMTRRPRHPELYEQVQRLVVQPRMDALLEILREGERRGEVAPEAVTPRIASVAMHLLVAEHMAGAPIPRAEIDAIISEVMVPLTAPRES